MLAGITAFPCLSLFALYSSSVNRLVDRGVAEVDELPAEGTVGCSMPDVFKTLPANGVLMGADESGYSPFPVVVVGADSAFFAIPEETASFHYFVIL